MRSKIGRVLAHFGQQQTFFSRAFECMNIQRDSKTKYMASFDANELERVVPIVVASFLNPRPSASQPVGEVSVSRLGTGRSKIPERSAIYELNNLHKLDLALRKLQA